MTDLSPKVENKVSTGNLLSVALVIIAGAIAWGKSQSDIGAMAQRIDAGEKRDDKTAETLDQVKGSIIELKGDNKSIKSDIERQGRQLDRMEQLLRQQTQPTGNQRTP